MRAALCIIIGLAAASISMDAAAEPDQQGLGAMSDLAGKVNAWRLTPGVLLARCVKEVPERDAALREVHESWSRANASLIGMIDRLIERVAPLLDAKASTENAAEARNRIVASTTDMINETYFKNEKISASQVCAGYDKIVVDLSKQGSIAVTRGFVYALEAMVASRTSRPAAATGPIRKPEATSTPTRAVGCRDEGAAVQQSGSPRMSVAELSERAQAGDAMAQAELGRRYGFGRGVAKDSATAFSWHEKAANQGVCSAQVNLANMYLNGEGVRKDGKLAEEWYTKAAELGSDRAQYALGYMYFTGTGVEKNGATAEKWFLMAANQGNFLAQRMLMSMYAYGDGVPPDSAKALFWARRARIFHW